MLFKIGDRVIFRSWAYPSMSGSIGEVVAIPEEDYDFYSVRFTYGGPPYGWNRCSPPTRMACRESELVPAAERRSA